MNTTAHVSGGGSVCRVVRRAPSKPAYEFAKRLFDLTVSGAAILALSPVFILSAALIYLEERGPVFYRGERIGRDGKVFHILKFRTMRLDADKIPGPSSAGDDDPRITKLGGILRTLKINELPQLFNVLNGSMSLVGPRPQVAWDVANYTDEETAILSVPPGITDYASIRFHNEGEILKGSTDPDADYIRLIRPEKIQLQLKYLRERSFLTDLKILFRTAWVLVEDRLSRSRSQNVH